jgi:hypothetical protein
MATALDIIKRSYRSLNALAITETLSNEDAEAALAALNDLIAGLNNDSLMVYQRVNRTKALTSSDGQYTIGSGGDIDTTRPLRIESAYTRDSSTPACDRGITIVTADRWARIPQKTTEGTYPRYLYYRPNYPLGEINLYPEPGSGLTLHMECWDQLASLATQGTSVSLPPGYDRLLRYGLAIELASEINPPTRIEARVEKLYNQAKADIQRVNEVNIPEMRCAITFNRNNYNILAGEYEN